MTVETAEAIAIESVPVLNKGFIRLDGYLADDLSVVNSARVSFNQRHDTMEAGDAGLIRFLMRERHGTPFEHNTMRFHVKAPLFVFREWQRHRISSFNEWSARYSEMKPDFYVPRVEHVRTQVGKPGAYTFEPVDHDIAVMFIERLVQEQEEAWNAYQFALYKGVAKEQARLFLPVSIYSEMYWTVNARSLMNFLSLRNDEHAQWEIRQYAEVIEALWSKLMPITYATFTEHGRVAP